ncbi:MAG: hypothetical protein QF376_04395 [Anaerolineales bacterium]|jgi:hypothetical protein|nr:hypothetical protein [Anaerolineales bacterium]HJO33694.1 hypothetical protein [Anaerolineales bacterium]|tara:strand:- start:240 stop:374 length:135 start_codon:yes stop_codon:yes gene_type:complete
MSLTSLCELDITPYDWRVAIYDFDTKWHEDFDLVVTSAMIVEAV